MLKPGLEKEKEQKERERETRRNMLQRKEILPGTLAGALVKKKVHLFCSLQVCASVSRSSISPRGLGMGDVRTWMIAGFRVVGVSYQPHIASKYS